MIRAEVLLDALRETGYGLVAGVPCSYLTPFINAVIDAPDLRYVGAANEGDAVAVAAGAELAGVRAAAIFQNSGLGNAVSPLTSLHGTFRIPILLVTTWRGRPGGEADEPQHDLMGRITPALLDIMEIPWELVPAEEEGLAPALERAHRHMAATGTPYALVAAKGAFAPRAPATPRAPRLPAVTQPARRERQMENDPDDLLRAVKDAASDDIVVATTGFTGRALYALGDSPNHFYMVGSMGCAASLGLGIALSRPERRVVVVDGDGSVLMRMGALAVVGREAPRNLVHVVLDNGVHDSTGGQATAASAVDFVALARSCGYAHAVAVDGPAELAAVLAENAAGPVLAYARTRPRSERKLPRPKITPPAVAARLRAALSEVEETPRPARPVRDRLLNPGPVTLSARVRAALARPDVCHREPEYGALQSEVRARLADVYGAGPEHAAVLLAGSGTSAVEAMVGSLVPRGCRALVAANGIYGERVARILAAQGKAHDVVRSAWTDGIDLARVEQTLASGRFDHVVAVHHETTTGRLNDVAALGDVCRARGVPLLLDAVSSFGGERMDLGAWGVEACAATANKCLHGAPGVAFVIARRESLQERSASATMSLDLALHFAEQEEGGPLFTPPVHVVQALAEALREHEEAGGWSGRRERHRALSRIVRAGLAGIGFGLLLDETAYAASLTSFELPPDTPFEALHDPLREDGFVVYPGHRSFPFPIFRVAVMGDLSPADMEEFVAAVGRVMEARGAGRLALSGAR